MPDAPKGGGFLNKKYAGISGKWWLIGGLAGGGAAYYVWRKETAATTSTDANDNTALDESTDSDAQGIDPTTGVPYADEENYDTGYDEAYGGAFGGNGNADEEPIYIQEPEPASTGTTTKANNRHWLNESIKALEGAGYTKAFATAALSAYLVGAPLTKRQLSAVEAAIKLEGTPPEHVPPVHEIPTPKPAKKTTRKPRKANPPTVHKPTPKRGK
jgi:hypothetical protein